METGAILEEEGGRKRYKGMRNGRNGRNGWRKGDKKKRAARDLKRKIIKRVRRVLGNV
jgi:hypothetical protein